MSAVQIERIDERRRALRVDEPCRVFVTERRPECVIPGWDETLAPIFGVTLNLSETGALLALDEPLPLGRLVCVGIEVAGHRLELPAVVMRVGRCRSSGVAHVGVRFARVPPRVHERLLAIVRARRPSPHLN